MTDDPLSPLDPALAAHGVTLSPSQRARLATYVALLEQWNARINLVGTTDRHTLLHRHLLDCLLLATIPGAARPRHWLDVGAGAGLPGLLLAVLFPAHRVTLVDTVAKKVTFQQVAVRTLGLDNAAPLRADAAQLAPGDSPFGPFDALVARAFAGLAHLLALGADLLPAGGEVWAMKGRRLAEEQARVPAATLAAYEPEPRLHTYAWAPGEASTAVGGTVAVYTRRGPTASGA